MIPLLLFQLANLVFLVQCADELQSTVSPLGAIDQPDLADLTGFSNRSAPDYLPGPIVSTSCGKFEGSSPTKEKGVQFEQFIGIRYAEPPVGKLRFKNPIPWQGYKPDKIYKVAEFCPPCMQPKKRAVELTTLLPSEDCLCLNIFRPAGCDKGSKKPVLFYIPGGYFLEGSGSRPEIRGGHLADYGDMIVVTVNYRLGAFGWLWSGNNEIPGDMGYYDTVLAAKWVKEYIGDFGGDPNAITIAGHGAGGTIATAYMYDINLPEDLFRSVMILSPDQNLADFIEPPWVAIRKSKDFARVVGCGDKDSDNSMELSDEAINCLRNADAKLLADRANAIPGDDGNGICAWEQLFPFYHPEKGSIDYRLENNLFFKNKRIYIGGVATESARSFEGSIAETKDQGREIIGKEIPPIIKNKSSKNLKAILDKYYGSVDPSDVYAIGKSTTAALDDVCNACPRLDLIQEMKKFNEVYVYFWTYVASSDRGSKKRKYRAFHYDDAPFNFGVPFKDYNKYNDYDRAVSQESISIWSDFVHGRKMKWPPRGPTPDSYQPCAYLEGVAKDNYYRQDPLAGFCETVFDA